jgi:hypothetical protein
MPDSAVTMHFKPNASSSLVKPRWSRQNVQAYYGNQSNPSTMFTLPDPTVECTINFTLPNEMKAPVLFYYRLTNFYQNHRRYAKSFNTDQLSGKAVSASTIGGSDCTSLTTVTGADKIERPYYPCGLAANSVFNDTFGSPILLNPGLLSPNGDPLTYVMNNNSGISWDSDKELYGPSQYNWADVLVPPNWQLRYPQGYSDDYHPDLVNDEPFQVWMRLAGLPTFSKLAQRNDTMNMPIGTYQLKINHRKPCSRPLFTIATDWYRIQCYGVWRNKVHCYLHSNRSRWQEPFPRHRLCRCSRHLRRPRHAFHHHTSDQAP